MKRVAKIILLFCMLVIQNSVIQANEVAIQTEIAKLDEIPYAEFYQKDETNFCERLQLNPELVKDFNQSLCDESLPFLQEMDKTSNPLNYMRKSQNEQTQKIERKQIYNNHLASYMSNPKGMELNGADNLLFLPFLIADGLTFILTFFQQIAVESNLIFITLVHGNLVKNFFE
ncbi:MAG: hypothetical protein ACRC6X_01685, partial [Culicoidibacterales bacterium]